MRLSTFSCAMIGRAVGLVSQDHTGCRRIHRRTRAPQSFVPACALGVEIRIDDVTDRLAGQLFDLVQEHLRQRFRLGIHNQWTLGSRRSTVLRGRAGEHIHVAATRRTRMRIGSAIVPGAGGTADLWGRVSAARSIGLAAIFRYIVARRLVPPRQGLPVWPEIRLGSHSRPEDSGEPTLSGAWQFRRRGRRATSR